jgi:transposase
VRALDTRSRGDLIRLADQQQVLLAELVAARERDRAEIAELRAANVRLAVGVAELRAERETAQVTIAELRAANEQLRARVLELEGELAKLKKGGPRGMPGLKSDEPVAPAVAKPRARRERGVGRARSAPTRSVVHAADRCPDCGSALSGGAVKRTREVIELVPSPAEVVEHVVLERRCPQCRRRVVPTVDLGDQVVGQQRLGITLLALIVTLREVGRLPVAVIQWYLATVHALHLSVGAIVAASHQVAARGAATVDQIREQVRAGPVVHADETGWRQNGKNGYLWTFSTPTERYFQYGGRDGAMVDQALGDAFAGVLVSDFYKAYDHVRCSHQRCWAHLLRDAHDLRKQYPKEAAVQTWVDALHRLYLDAVAFVATASADPLARAAAASRFDARLLALAQPFLTDRSAPQHILSKRIAHYLGELLTFVREPDVPPDNNAAERSLRHLVTTRKISGGSRSPDGTATKVALATLFGTWRAQDINPFLACRQLLSPQV